jgi:hypothetical protein
MVVSTELKILYSLLCRKYINHIQELSFVLSWVTASLQVYWKGKKGTEESILD